MSTSVIRCTDDDTPAGRNTWSDGILLRSTWMQDFTACSCPVGSELCGHTNQILANSVCKFNHRSFMTTLLPIVYSWSHLRQGQIGRADKLITYPKTDCACVDEFDYYYYYYCPFQEGWPCGNFETPIMLHPPIPYCTSTTHRNYMETIPFGLDEPKDYIPSRFLDIPDESIGYLTSRT
jgi:hypothetical protein